MGGSYRENGVKDEAASDRSRSRSPSRERSKGRSRSRSRSRSRDRRRSYSRSPRRSYRSRSRSPGYRSRPPPPRGGGGGGRGGRYYDGRDNPEPNRCLGVFGMSLHTTERDLKKIFGQYGEVTLPVLNPLNVGFQVESVELVYDRFSGRSRGFGFVYFVQTRDATRAKEHLMDAIIDGMKVRVDYSVTRTGGPGRHDRSPPRRSPRRRGRSRSPRRRSYSRSRSRSPYR
ncbi:RNA recognition domain-containing protein domain-containing protein [Aphelenchoides avenae]|nr:RNA recognition domain-containing protein domain-containing protein [Aphelenchus avenae]